MLIRIMMTPSPHHVKSTTKHKKEIHLAVTLSQDGRVQSVFQLALVGVQPSSAEELPDNSSKGLEETLLDRVANESAIADYFPSCLHHDRLPRHSFYYYFIMMEQSTGHVQEKI